jgi:hypothetical protein
VGVTQGKQLTDTADFTAPHATLPHTGTGAAAGGHPTTQPVNPNLPQPYYQTAAYSPVFSPGAGGTSCGPWPEARPPIVANTPFGLSTDWVASGEMSDGVREQVTHTLRELGFAPRGWAKAYKKPYPEYFDTVPYPRGFRVPDFVKFTGEDTRTTYEHIGQFFGSG